MCIPAHSSPNVSQVSVQDTIVVPTGKPPGIKVGFICNHFLGLQLSASSCVGVFLTETFICREQMKSAQGRLERVSGRNTRHSQGNAFVALMRNFEGPSHTPANQRAPEYGWWLWNSAVAGSLFYNSFS
jgi:hypothetical protein